MKVILHTEFDIFTYKAVGAAVGILIYAILAYTFPQVDLLIACLIAFLIGSLVWYLLFLFIIKRYGVCFEFRYSKNRLGFASVTLSRRCKKLDYMEFELPVDVGSYNKGLEDQISPKLKYFFNRYLNDISDSEVIHFVGCSSKDADQIINIFAKQKVKTYT